MKRWNKILKRECPNQTHGLYTALPEQKRFGFLLKKGEITDEKDTGIDTGAKEIC